MSQCRNYLPVRGRNDKYLKTLCIQSLLPETTEGQELLNLFDQMCPAHDPSYEPPTPEPGTPICVQCKPANPELLVVFEQMADILEL